MQGQRAEQSCCLVGLLVINMLSRGVSSDPLLRCAQAELKAVKTATLTTEVVDGFEVLHTTSVADTFRLYATITKRLVVTPLPCATALHWLSHQAARCHFMFSPSCFSASSNVAM